MTSNDVITCARHVRSLERAFGEGGTHLQTIEEMKTSTGAKFQKKKLRLLLITEKADKDLEALIGLWPKRSIQIARMRKTLSVAAALLRIDWKEIQSDVENGN